MEYRSKTAIVLGGSMAGMLAARVLSDHFGRVLVVERDQYPSGATARAGVPQARHLHALLMRGHTIVEDLFPGITEDWLRSGAELLDVGEDFAWRTPPGWGVRFPSGVKMLAASRPLIDFAVLQRLSQIRNVAFVQGFAATGLEMDADQAAVVGVRGRTEASAREHVLKGDLIVDASGRMSRAPEWLEESGYGRPDESVVDAQLGYASRIYRRRHGQQSEWKAVFLQAAPPEQPRAGIAFPIEDDKWMVTLSGGGGDFAPTDEREFNEFARSLPSAQVYNLIRNSEPLTPIVGYRRTGNQWRHYERLKKMPEGFALIGDSVCAFNPVYGQGMTTAALEAEALGEHLREHRGGRWSETLQAKLARIIATPWALATGEDLRYRGVSARKPSLPERFLQAHVSRVMGVSTYDVTTRLALLEVFTMMAPPQRLLRPSILAKAALYGLRRRSEPPMYIPKARDAEA